jgi:hypothetical protein
LNGHAPWEQLSAQRHLGRCRRGRAAAAVATTRTGGASQCRAGYADLAADDKESDEPQMS